MATTQKKPAGKTSPAKKTARIDEGPSWAEASALTSIKSVPADD